MNITIRYANIQDKDDLGIIHSNSLQSAFKGIIDDSILENSFSVEKRRKGFGFELEENKPLNIIMFKEENPIGLMSIGESRYEEVDESCIEIWRIYLIPEVWGEGLGKVLMNWGINEIKNKGYKKIILWVLDDNTNARKFYENLGFKQEGVTRYINVGKDLKEIKYVKEIN